jgi:hypothetical protein
VSRPKADVCGGEVNEIHFVVVQVLPLESQVIVEEARIVKFIVSVLKWNTAEQHVWEKYKDEPSHIQTPHRWNVTPE